MPGRTVITACGTVSAGGGHELMRSQEVTHLAHRLGTPVLRRLPGMSRVTLYTKSPGER